MSKDLEKEIEEVLRLGIEFYETIRECFTGIKGEGTEEEFHALKKKLGNLVRHLEMQISDIKHSLEISTPSIVEGNPEAKADESGWVKIDPPITSMEGFYDMFPPHEAICESCRNFKIHGT